MPARQRGSSLNGAKSRPKAAKSSAKRVAKSGRAVAYAPTKLSAAQGVRVPGWLAGGVAVLAIGVGTVVAFSTGGRGEMLGQAVARQAAGAGFQVRNVHIQGATPLSRPDILAASGVSPGDPILGLDLSAVRERVGKVGWTREVKVVRLLPDTVVIAVSERPPLAVWQEARRLRVVDGEGAVIGEADPADFPNLPLVVGEGANEAAGEILPLLRARPRLMARLEAVVRVDNRRWDVRLKDGTLVQLPAIDEDAALIQLDQLDQQQKVLDLGFSRIDLRQPSMAAFRPREKIAAAPSAAAGV